MRCLVLLLVACSATPVKRPVVDARTAWATLQRTLPGSWTATTGSSSVPVEFHMIAGGSALLETFGRPGKQTATAYSADGVDLVATHYCAQGNQPRLRAREADDRHVVLVQTDATGVDPGESVLVELSYTFDADGFERVEIYRDPSGALDRTVWRYVRAP